MDSRRSGIREHQEAVDELALSIDRQKGELGRVLLEKADVAEDVLNGPLQSALETKEELEQIEDRRDRLKKALDGKIETSDKIKELEQERSEYEKSKTEFLREIGRKGWDLYRHNGLEEEEFASFFSEIAERDREIEEVEKRTRDLDAEREQGGLLKKVSLAAKLTVTKNRSSRLQNSMEELFVDAGQDLVASGKVEEIPDEEMRRYTSQLKDVEDSAEERESEHEKLQKSLEKYEKEIEELSEGYSPEKKLKSIDEGLSSKQDEHFQRLQRLGDTYLNRPELHDREDDTVRTILERIDDLEAQKGKHQDQIHILQSMIERDELESEIKKKEESISKSEKKVEEQKEEIKKLKEEVGNDKNRLSDLNKMITGRGETAGLSEKSESSAETGAEVPEQEKSESKEKEK